jgi:hypothetical protein
MKNKVLWSIVVMLFAVQLLIDKSDANQTKLSICIGGANCRADYNYSCDFAFATPLGVGPSACEETCARRDGEVISCTAGPSRAGGPCGYLVETVMCSK